MSIALVTFLAVVGLYFLLMRPVLTREGPNQSTAWMIFAGLVFLLAVAALGGFGRGMPEECFDFKWAC